MNDIITTNASSLQVISTIDLREFINEARAFSGEAKIRNDQFIQRVEDELEGELGVCKNIAHPQSGVEMKFYYLTIKQATLVGMRESKAVRRRVLEKLDELATKTSTVSALPQDYISALEHLLASKKAEQLAIAQRDDAIATKAEIGHRREATAMNTASQAVKKANKLEIELDKSKEYATIKRMEMLYHGTKFNWRILKSASTEMGVEAINVFDQNYGTVKAYHYSVWKEAYALSIGGEQ